MAFPPKKPTKPGSGKPNPFGNRPKPSPLPGKTCPKCKMPMSKCKC